MREVFLDKRLMLQGTFRKRSSLVILNLQPALRRQRNGNPTLTDRKVTLLTRSLSRTSPICRLRMESRMSSTGSHSIGRREFLAGAGIAAAIGFSPEPGLAERTGASPLLVGAAKRIITPN